MPENYDVSSGDDPNRKPTGDDPTGEADRPTSSGESAAASATSGESATSAADATRPSTPAPSTGASQDSPAERTTQISAEQLAAGTGTAAKTDSAASKDSEPDLAERETRPAMSTQPPAADGTQRIEPPEAEAERTQSIPKVPADEGHYASPTDFLGAPGFPGSATDRVEQPPADQTPTTQAVAGSFAQLPAEQTQYSGRQGPYSNQQAQFPTEQTQFPTVQTGFPEADAERTQNIPKVPAEPSPWATGFAGGIGGGFAEDPPEQTNAQRNRRGLIRGGIAAGIAVGLLTLLYVGDLVFSSGTVPRGTTVADVQVGGLTEAAAQRKLREELGPNLQEPVQLKAGDATATISPEQSGLTMDWPATIEQAGEQPLNPFTRIASLFTDREIYPVSHGDEQQVMAAVEQVKPKLERAASEGTIKFEGTKPVAVEPVTGRAVDVSVAADQVMADWAKGGPVQVPFNEQAVNTTSDGVHQALRNVAQPAVSGPVSVKGEGHDAALAPETIAAALRFEPDGKGGLRSHLDAPTLVGGLEPQLRDTMKPAKDAEIVLEGGGPVVRPSLDGRGVNWDKSFEKLDEVVKQKQNRTLQAVYEQQPPAFNTDHANGLGIREVISEFKTEGFETASGVNIKRTAEQVNGAVVKPGDTFSLNGHTGPRGTAQGYVESGIIEDGRPAKAVGGGISQFATTLYNASYFAGVKDVEHKEHSYYISRYPAGREATVFQNPDGSSVIDVKFKNTLASGVMITTEWTPSSITVKFWGTKQYDVGSKTGPRTAEKPPHEKVVPPGEPCSPSKGTGGFTVTDTRTLKDVKTGKVTTESPSKTVYNPQPIIHCGPPPAPR
ncbi:VanW family protein [Saccharopolyspora gloriosae]|uniref:VanW family protein n=1 Tax=Saccharopolyspora gloriosae TaxID=455344 RepID=UPI001FB5EEB7|nr:VanW family protein [Saccharopolyspora gloriosae]